MPIKVFTELRVFGQEEFHALDRRFMRVVFDVHNEFGRLLDESIYHFEIAVRCRKLGIGPVETEVRIQVTHESFAKDYFMDLLLVSGVPVELKAVEALAPAHRAQALNYLLLAGLRHGRLVNLRTERVQHEFVSTSLAPEDRRRFSVLDSEWSVVNERSAWLRGKVIELLRDWGAFLDVGLYREAITHFLGGPEVVCRKVEILGDNGVVGLQASHLLTDDTAFAITTLIDGSEPMREHLRRFLRHTRLEHLQWINLNHHRIEFATLSR